MSHQVSCELGGKKLTIETGKLAKQAGGSVFVSYGDTRVLVTACSAKEPKPGMNFFPLTVEYTEKFYSAGKIPGSFFRREGRPSSEEVLTARMIDRPIRPLFPEGYYVDTQIIATVMSLDPEADPKVAASIGASAALSISDAPFNGPTAAVRVGKKNGSFVINPSWAEIHTDEEGLDLEIFVAGSKDAIMMVEGGADEASEEDVLQAILKGHEEIKKVVKVIEDLQAKCGKEKREFTPEVLEADVVKAVKSTAEAKLKEALSTKDKKQRYQLVDDAKASMLETVVPESLKADDAETAAKKEAHAKAAFSELQYNLMRQMILKDKVRIDGRDSTTIRQIDTEVGILPRAHGSSLFTRGETQVLASTTLGTADDEAIVDSVYESSKCKYFLHYNFPPYSVGETGRFGGQSRREIGHGHLAERAIRAVLPKHEDFPYTLRIVCETLESNGSSSMGSVCSASMALMDAGVPTAKPVAGIAMGLIKEGNDVAVLSDILGDEDHLGDMDFKVAGTKDGICAIQMDIKISGVSEEIMRTALSQAKEGRLHILGRMSDSITQSREKLANHAPQIHTIQIPVDKIGLIIGPGGKNIKAITAETGCKLDISDDGRVNVAATSGEAAQAAIDIIQGMVAEPELDKIYKGVVKKIVDFGAFVGILPNYDGLLHISEIAHERVNRVEDYLKEGDEVEVKVLEIDRGGKVRLSRKALLDRPEPSKNGDSGDRGGRGGQGRPSRTETR